MGHHKMQQAEFGGPERQQLAVTADAVADRIELKTARFDYVVSGLRRTPRSNALIRALSSRGENGLVM